MQFTFESQGSNTFLVYEMNGNEKLDSMTFGMVENNKLEGIIPFIYTQMDKQRLLKYNVSSRVSLDQYFNGIVNRKRLIGVMLSLASAVMNAQDYMLEADSFIWDKKYIFVDVSTARAELICLPVLKERPGTVELETIFKDMFFGVQFDQTENCDYIAKLLGFFNANAHFSLQEFVKLIRDLNDEENVKSKLQNPVSVVQKMDSAAVTAPAPAQEKVPGTMPGEMTTVNPPVKPQQISVSPAANASGKQQPTMVQATQPSKEKKGFHLLGKKDKEKKGKEKKEKEQKEVKGNLPGRSSASIPGMPSAPANIPNAVPRQVQNSVQVQQSAAVQKPVVSQQPAVTKTEQQGIGNAYVAPAYQTQKGSFGGTTVLNAGNANPGTVVLSEQNNPYNRKAIPYLIRIRNGQRYSLEKDITRIGSDAAYADFVISDNRAVSRSHADVRIRNDQVFLVDNNSTNHTYIEGRMMNPNEEECLADGSKFRLADEEFELHMF